MVDKNMQADSSHGNKMTEYIFSRSSGYAMNCSIHDQTRWPTSIQMSLDESQYKAIKLALTNEITLIQG
jgi:hypothetical protein